MKINCLTLLLFFTGTTLMSAQSAVDKILQNPDISWAQEYTYDIDPDLGKLGNKEKGFLGSQSSLIKFTASPIEGEDIYDLYDSYAAYCLKSCVMHAEKMPIYKDKKLQQKLGSKEALMARTIIDTIVTFNPNTFEEIVEVVARVIPADGVSGFRQYGILYFNKKEKSFNVLPISMAPLIKQFNSAGDESGAEVAFWFAVNLTDKTAKSRTDISWINRAVHDLNTSKKSNLKKQQSQAACWSLYMKNAVKQGKKSRLYNGYEILGDKKLTPKEIAALGSSVDTVITYDPETFEEALSIVTNELEPNNIKEFRIIQDWVWDRKKKELSIRNLGYAPFLYRYDELKNFLYKAPLFYYREKSVR